MHSTPCLVRREANRRLAAGLICGESARLRMPGCDTVDAVEVFPVFSTDPERKPDTGGCRAPRRVRTFSTSLKRPSGPHAPALPAGRALPLRSRREPAAGPGGPADTPKPRQPHQRGAGAVDRSGHTRLRVCAGPPASHRPYDSEVASGGRGSAPGPGRLRDARPSTRNPSRTGSHQTPPGLGRSYVR
jgi:hypothetical protein